MKILKKLHRNYSEVYQNNFDQSFWPEQPSISTFYKKKVVKMGLVLSFGQYISQLKENGSLFCSPSNSRIK
ncbi:Predicted protein [Mesomycoplasma hyopneumoniae 168]|uniref:Uncharacterized protein n=2 Tax=Mesomycoplasma hyopneumoniae (strain 168) TaxID=907287 RepID=E4QSL7_MESH1|nr:Predicted protein [Mesomycoplasma hyopneumoniae 168]AGM21995.1 hypothetical protein MHP168L_213 [Mesomycoplasma hyopneumoniae 168-L]